MRKVGHDDDALAKWLLLWSVLLLLGMYVPVQQDGEALRHDGLLWSQRPHWPSHAQQVPSVWVRFGRTN